MIRNIIFSYDDGVMPSDLREQELARELHVRLASLAERLNQEEARIHVHVDVHNKTQVSVLQASDDLAAKVYERVRSFHEREGY